MPNAIGHIQGELTRHIEDGFRKKLIVSTSIAFAPVSIICSIK